MKRHFLLPLLMVTVFSACNKENTIQTTGDNQQGEGNLMTFSVASPSGLAKTHLGETVDDVTPVLFDDSDQLWICESTGVSALFTTSADKITDGGSKASFSGELEGEAPFYAVFPYAYAVEKGDESLVLNIPSSQTYAVNSFGKTSNVSAAVCLDGSSFTLKNLCGCLKVSFYGNLNNGTANRIGTIEIVDNNPDFALWGKCTVPTEEDVLGDPVFTNTDVNKNKITLTTGVISLGRDAATDFYITVPEGAFAKGVTMTLIGPKGVVLQTISTDKDLTVSRGHIKSLGKVDVSVDKFLFSGGAGTEQSPYRIACPEDLGDMVKFINSGESGFADAYYAQTKDIDIATLETSPLTDHIGTAAHPFKGVYDGAGHKIENISFASIATDEAGQGLFGTADGAAIKNVKVVGYTSPTAKGRHGVIAGNITNTVVDNCSVSGTISAFVGGISGGVVGYNGAGSTVSNCTVTADLSSNSDSFGGIVGENYGKVKKCTVIGNLSQTGSTNGTAGIVGQCYSAEEISVEDCRYSGNITSVGKNTAGIVGRKAEGNSTISGCVASGNYSLTGSQDQVGGIIGGIVCSCTVKNCESYANVSSGTARAGGIVSYYCCAGGKLVIDGCIVRGNVKGASCVGGIVGELSDNAKTGNNQTVWIVNSACIGSAIESTGTNTNGNPLVGGLIGSAVENVNSLFQLINCVSRPSTINIPSGIAFPCPAGLVGTNNPGANAGACAIYGCYTTIKESDFLVGGSSAAAPSQYGAIVGNVARAGKLTVSHTYYDATCSRKYGNSAPGTETDVTTISSAADLLGKLNAAVSGYTPEVGFPALCGWVASEEDGYPIQTIFSGKSAALTSNAALPAVTAVEGEDWVNY